ncbi:MAG: hypothetical protein AB7P11_21380, partial [Hydrogenophaga sp.]
MANPVDPRTVTYAIRRPDGDIVHLAHAFPGFDFGGAQGIVRGGIGDDEVWVGAGLSVDATQLNAGTNRIYFTGELGEYTQTIAANGLYTFTHNERSTEVVTIYSQGSNDELWFANGHILFNAELDARLYDENSAQPYQQIQAGWLSEGGTPNATPDATLTIDSISEDTGPSGQDFVTSDADGLTIHATLSRGLNAVASQGSMAPGDVLRVAIQSNEGVD